jgi:prevent-host-death family protein
MPILTFRNRQGDLVDVPEVAATRLKNEFGSVLEQALRGGAVAITRHDTPKAVLVSYEEFESLVKERSHDLRELGAEYDALLERMQASRVKKGMAAAFDADPAELGRAAAAAARPATAKRKAAGGRR